MANIKEFKNRKGKKGFRIKWYDHNSVQRKKTIYLPLTQARAIAERLEREAREVRAGLREAPDESPTVKVSTFEFLKASEIDGKSDQTILRYKKVFKPFQGWFGEQRKLRTITKRMLEEYKAMRSRTVQPTSLNTELRHLKAFFSWAVDNEYLGKSPISGVKLLKTETKPPRFLSGVEIDRLYETIAKRKDQRAWDLVTFYLQTGARASEILESGGFTWDSVHEDHIEIIGKGRKRRLIPLSDTLREILERRRDERVPFPYSYSAVSQSLSRRLFHRAGIPDANLHALRRTAGALLIQKGVDIYRVSKFLGHSSVTVTEKHYVDLLRSDYQDMSDILGGSAPALSKVTEAGASEYGEAA